MHFARNNSGLPKLLHWSHALRSDQNGGLPKFALLVARTSLGPLVAYLSLVLWSHALRSDQNNLSIYREEVQAATANEYIIDSSLLQP